MNNQIGIIHPYFNSLGGSEAVCDSLINGLLKSDFQVNLYTILKPSIHSDKIKIIQPRETRLLDKLPSRLRKMLYENKLMQISKNEPLIIITSGSLFNMKTKSKVIIYCNSNFASELQYIKSKSNFPKSIYDNILKRETKTRILTLKNGRDLLISNSKYTHDFIVNNFGIESTVIYPPVNTKKYLQVYDNEKRQQICIISRASKEKNLIEAVNILNSLDYESHIVCSSSSREQLEYFEQIHSISSKKIHYYHNTPINKQDLLGRSKVYLQSSSETFGISVVEAICAGCIPVVPNNSANIETVPFSELRYNTTEQCICIINDVMSGKYDYLKLKLLEHGKQFSLDSFQDKILQIISNVAND